MDLVCPKCQGAMRTYERSSVTVDQCTECRGIFLDRGELERLVDAETSWHQSERPAPAPPRPAPPQAQPQPQYREEYRGGQSSGYGGGHGGGYGHGGSYGHKKRKSFLEELFD